MYRRKLRNKKSKRRREKIFLASYTMSDQINIKCMIYGLAIDLKT